MICPKCGDDLPKDAITSKSCGNKVGTYRDSRRIIVMISIVIILLIIAIIGLYITDII